jgi:hypothetical protein
MKNRVPTRHELGSKLRENRWLIFVAIMPITLLSLWRVLYVYDNYLSTAKLDVEVKTLDALFKITSISTLIIGAGWSYRAFFRQRLAVARINVDHEIKQITLPNGDYLLKVYATVENIGQIKVVLPCWRLSAEQILPLDSSARLDRKAFTDKEFPWLSVADGVFTSGNREHGEAFWMLLEPGEEDQASGNLVIHAGVEVVQVYSHFSLAVEEGSQGWERRVIVDLREAKSKEVEEQMSEQRPKDKTDLSDRILTSEFKTGQQHHTPPIRPSSDSQSKNDKGAGPKGGGKQ